jgi:organic hydroperoxide reductase OsmC/OhrA
MKTKIWILLLMAGAAVAQKTEWQFNLEWSMQDTGVWESYLIPQVASRYPECLPTGKGRKCIMEKAIASAHAGDFNNAFELSLLTQGHNPHAKGTIADAGRTAVGNFLKTK